ncbi:hypothetical protein HanIR_Chr11g0554641 [Helianthus annuus]|nr:hypothetical protein HanIR_Chr11g0554641 [Helianthus annuus]
MKTGYNLQKTSSQALIPLVGSFADRTSHSELNRHTGRASAWKTKLSLMRIAHEPIYRLLGPLMWT